MSMAKILVITAGVLLGGMALVAVFKEKPSEGTDLSINRPEYSLPIEIDIEPENKPFVAPPPEKLVTQQTVIQKIAEPQPVEVLPETDCIQELFNTKDPRLSIVETIKYKSRVPWLKGRPAWLSDYASHYETSRHFIARSLNGKPDYFKQDIAEGDLFNVLRLDKPIEFHLIIDTSCCKLWFYCFDLSTQKKILLKTYSISLGRPDSSKASGLLTPLGKYSLGSRIAIYKAGIMGNYKGQKIEMRTVFGTRWIPFDKEINAIPGSAKGIGLHGMPWIKTSDGKWQQDLASLGKYESDGCIRMASDDIEEIFAIIITKPSFIELVKNFKQSEIHTK